MPCFPYGINIYLSEPARKLWNILCYGKSKMQRLFSKSNTYLYRDAPKVYTQMVLLARPTFLHPRCPSPIYLLVIIPSHVPKTIDTAPPPLRGPCKVVTGHICIVIIVIIIAVPLRSFALPLPLALRIYLLSGAGAADWFWTFARSCRLKMVFHRRSWDFGGSSKIRRFLRIANAFEGPAHALIMFELFDAVGRIISAKHRGKYFKKEKCLPHTTDQFSISTIEVLLGDHDSNVLIRSQMIKKVSRSDWSTRQGFDFGISC